MTPLFLALTAAAAALLLLALIIFFLCRRTRPDAEDVGREETELPDRKTPDSAAAAAEEEEKEDLMVFGGGEDLTIGDILDAPGEVIGKSNYGTLYRAQLLQGGSGVKVLRFLRPICAARGGGFVDVVEVLGGVRHRNLVPVIGFYAGPRGEKLLICPFYRRGNLADFIRDGTDETYRWATIYKISIGLARGLDHLHTGMPKPVIHGNLKSKNVFFDRHYEPCISDHGLHLLLNATAGQEMLDSSASEGYKAPELIKMKDANVDTDIYAFGVILLELITGKEPIIESDVNEIHLLPDYMRSAVLGPRILDLFHPGILSGLDDSALVEEKVLKLFQVAMSCCSPSPSLRPTTRQALRKLDEIGR